MSHPHADLIKQAADWYPNYRWRNGCGDPWHDPVTYPPQWFPEFEYEIKQTFPHLYQKRVKIPEPLRKAPEVGSIYFCANPSKPDYYVKYMWFGDMLGSRLLERGLAFATAEDAAARGRAMLETERDESG